MVTNETRFAIDTIARGREAIGAGAGNERFESTKFRERGTYLDTFDWRLSRAGLTLFAGATASGVELTLRRIDGELERRALAADLPAFACELPVSPLRRAVESLIGIRRLLPRVEVAVEGESIDVLDGRGKVVARVRIEEPRARLPGATRFRPCACRLRCSPLRGYQEAAARIVGGLEQQGLERAPGHEIDDLLGAIGQQRDDYSSKVEVVLDGRQRCDVAVRQVLRSLATVIVRNEPGVRADLDPEFLHDFRVAVRRSRAVLSQIRGVFPAVEVRRLQAGLRWIQGATGPLRDLHVLTGKLPGYRLRLSARAGDDLEPVSRHLEARARAAPRRLVRDLDTVRYRRLMTGFAGFLARGPAPRTRLVNAARPIRDVAGRRAWKVYSRLLRDGEAIDDRSPSAEFHQLRLRAKKLRYLLESFVSIYPRGIEREVKALKKLQEVLGDFHDFSVQRQALRALAHELEKPELGELGAVDTQLAIGQLLDSLRDGQNATRASFALAFARFSSSQRRRSFRRDLRLE